MMPARKLSLIDRLPPVRGQYRADVALGPRTWFRVGGRADVVFRPADVEDLAAFFAARPADVPVTILGVGSNVLIRDDGIEGIVVRLGRNFADVVVNGEWVTAGAGALDVSVALSARDAGLTGLEFLRGIPGTIGGGLKVNAGAFGGEFKDVLVSAEAVDFGGQVHHFTAVDLGLGYRSSRVSEGYVFTRAEFHAAFGDREQIDRRMADITANRNLSQPVHARTGGSTFVNPSDPKAGGRKAWQLIEEAGCRGLKLGGAQVSEQHCNFLVNAGSATAADLEELGEIVRRRVFDRFGLWLEWEIYRIGRPAPRRGGGA